MAAIIGNIVLLIIIISFLRSITGTSPSITRKTRKFLKSIDTSLSEQEILQDKKKNPTRYLDFSDHLILAALIVHPETKKAKCDLSVSEKQAQEIRSRLLQEIVNK